MAACPPELELERFVEGDAAPAERARLEAHLGECAACRAWLEEARADEALLPELRRARALPPEPPPEDPAPEPAEGSALARYRIIRRLGAGGMGVVYEAEQKNPRRRVALKMLAAAIVSERALRAFEREAEVLGRLSHPSIAQILEAGTYTAHGESRPFFAMELVAGLPLTDFAERGRLGVRRRIELFATVCDAVQHAHQMGVVHRDLKPANVLVTEDGNPKVLDFGVARTFDTESGQFSRRTQVAEVVGTLPYISPEQLAGDPLAVDTRTDVYALGVTLYELLSGRPPFRVATRSLAEAVRIIERQEPPPLGSLDPELGGDLEVIAHKALAKDKDRRYASAAALADDLRRHLRFEPIAARPPSAVYHLRKFARRNRAVVAGLSLTFAALAAGLGAASWQARRALAAESAAVDQAERALAAERAATEQAQRAEQAEGEALAQAATVQESNAFFQALVGFDSDDPMGVTRTGATTLRELMRDAGQRLDHEPFSDPETEATLRIAIGNAQRRFGELDSAVDVLQRALELREGALGPEHLLVAETLNTLGVALSDGRRPREALDAWRRALEIYRAHVSPEPEMEATTLGNLALTLIGQGQVAEAEDFLFETLNTHRELLGEDSLHVVTDLGYLSYLRRVQGRREEAIELLEQAVAIARRGSQLAHPHALSAMETLCALLLEGGRVDEAWALLGERVEQTEQGLGVHEGTGSAHSDAALVALLLELPDEALAHATRAVEIFEQVEQEGPGGSRSPSAAEARAVLGAALVEVRDLERALACFEEARAVLGAGPPRTLRAACLQASNGRCLAGLGRRAEAERLLLAALAVIATQAPDEHPAARHALEAAAALYEDWERPAEAAAFRARAGGG